MGGFVEIFSRSVADIFGGVSARSFTSVLVVGSICISSISGVLALGPC